MVLVDYYMVLVERINIHLADHRNSVPHMAEHMVGHMADHHMADHRMVEPSESSRRPADFA
jgi:hypothetical protein